MYVSSSVPSKDVVPILRSMAEQDPKKAGVLGKLFTDGAEGIAQNEAEAMRYLRHAAEGGAPSALCFFKIVTWLRAVRALLHAMV